MPTFCRHNRFIERCPICSKTLPGHAEGAAPARGAPSRRAASAQRSARPARPRGESLRVHREGRAEDDGYRSALVPGLRASADAVRLVEEIAFAAGRLLALATAPVGLYAEARALAETDLPEATRICFLIAYLSPLEVSGEVASAGVSAEDPSLLDTFHLDGQDPFYGIRLAVAEEHLSDLDGIPLGPRTSHDPARGTETLRAYESWVEKQAGGFAGEPGWSPQRRFERLFERLALPGFGRMGRYDLLVTLGRLGLYEMQGDSLHLSSIRGLSTTDLTTLGAKRLFAIGDPIHLERRAAALAQAIDVPLQTLDLALANWASPQRATLGFPPETSDPGADERARGALGL